MMIPTHALCFPNRFAFFSTNLMNFSGPSTHRLKFSKVFRTCSYFSSIFASCSQRNCCMEIQQHLFGEFMAQQIRLFPPRSTLSIPEVSIVCAAKDNGVKVEYRFWVCGGIVVPIFVWSPKAEMLSHNTQHCSAGEEDCDSRAIRLLSRHAGK